MLQNTDKGAVVYYMSSPEHSYSPWKRCEYFQEIVAFKGLLHVRLCL